MKIKNFDNFVKLKAARQPKTDEQDKTDSFDYDQGFNIDEVYDSPDGSNSEMSTKCPNCGNSIISGAVKCKYCEKAI